jgi:hypothetical protein
MNDALCVQCRLSRLDSKAAAQQQPLRRAFCQALEQYFSCRATNGSLCGEPRWQRAVSLLNEWLLVRFRPVVIRTCSSSQCDGESRRLSVMLVDRPERYSHWPRLNFRRLSGGPEPAAPVPEVSGMFA